MKEVYKPDLKVGDVVYVPHNIQFTRFTYYTKETITRITPKKTKFVTNKHEYDRYTSFYLEDDELLRKDEVARAYMKTVDVRMLINTGRLVDMDNKSLIEISEHMKAIEKILKGD